jgi:tetratricopeptide (TPR) repeat protein
MALVALVALVLAAGCAKKATQSVETPAPVDEGAQLFDDGKYEEAHTYYQGVLQTDSTDIDATIYMGRIALRQDDYDGAILWMEKALALAPDSSNVHYWAATAYVVKVQRENAFMLVDKVKSHIETAVELDSTNVDARMFLAGFLLNAPPMVGGSVEKAKEQADIVVGLDPFRGQLFCSPDPYYYLGMMYQGNEAFDEAFAAFEKALTVDPEATASLYQVGRTGVISGENLDRSIEALQQYLKTDPPQGQPTLANAHWRLGQLYELKGDLEQARGEFEAALALNPDDENAKKSLENLGQTGEDD